jgi:hypothetical protein
MQKEPMQHNHYGRLVAMSALSFVSMYVLMYAMVDSASSVYNNFNQFYMAALMTAPMILIELWLMRSMFQNKRLNALVMASAVVVGGVAFLFIRQQTAISDTQFLRSMIPHHSGAILMCEEASIRNPKIQELCKSIVSSQQAEIDQMRSILGELDGSQ